MGLQPGEGRLLGLLVAASQSKNTNELRKNKGKR